MRVSILAISCYLVWKAACCSLSCTKAAAAAQGHPLKELQLLLKGLEHTMAASMLMGSIIMGYCDLSVALPFQELLAYAPNSDFFA